MKGFKPIINAKSKVLILGTFPSQSSLKMKQYYANATNLFWPLSMLYWKIRIMRLRRNYGIQRLPISTRNYTY